MVKLIGRIFVFTLFAFIVYVVMLAALQHKLIYFPRGYDAAYDSFRPRQLVELTYATAEGQQIVFYVPPRDSAPQVVPEVLWVLFGGNAALALDWSDFVSRYPDPQTGFLLMDYPGYGKCAGEASPQSILASTEAALLRLSAYLHTEREQLALRMNILGHSLGAATALQFGVQHPVQRVVLLSPFTSLQDMASLVVGGLLSQLLLHHFDNRARLTELVQRASPPVITIMHGAQDEVIPVVMGRELAKLFPQNITYLEIPHMDHNSIIHHMEKQIYATMRHAQ